MSDSAFEAALAYVQNRLEQEWTHVAPPDFFTTVRDATWPNFGPGDDREAFTELLQDSQEQDFVRMWVEAIFPSNFAEDNVGEFFLLMKHSCVYVVRSPTNLQRRMAAASATMLALYQGNPDRSDPDYSGDDRPGVVTTLDPSWGIQWKYPRVAGAYGAGVLWGMWNVEYRHPFPKG